MRDHAKKSGDAYLLVYAIDDCSSFDEAKHLYQDILLARDGSPITPPVVLAGNKVDLAAERKVTFVEASEAARHIFKCLFLETSAKDGTNAHTGHSSRSSARPGGTNATKPPASLRRRARGNVL